VTAADVHAATEERNGYIKSSLNEAAGRAMDWMTMQHITSHSARYEVTEDSNLLCPSAPMSAK